MCHTLQELPDNAAGCRAGGIGLVICDVGANGALLEKVPSNEQVGGRGCIPLLTPHSSPVVAGDCGE